MRRSLIGLIFYIVISLFFLAFQFHNPVRFFRKFVFYLFIPAPETLGYLINKSKDFSQTLHAILSAYGENIRLQERIAELKIKEQRCDEIFFENERINKFLGTKEFSEYKLLPARIIGKDPLSYPRTLLIDKGEVDGIRRDLPLLALGSHGIGVVGKIFEVFKNSSQVMLIDDPRSEISGMVQNSREDGVVRGRGKYELEMIYLAPTADIRKGDLIVTSGFGGIFSKGWSIGRVIDVSSEKYEFQKTAKLAPLISPKNLEEVFILIADPGDNETIERVK